MVRIGLSVYETSAWCCEFKIVQAATHPVFMTGAICAHASEIHLRLLKTVVVIWYYAPHEFLKSKLSRRGGVSYASM